jgi:hypothetical protein
VVQQAFFLVARLVRLLAPLLAAVLMRLQAVGKQALRVRRRRLQMLMATVFWQSNDEHAMKT